MTGTTSVEGYPYPLTTDFADVQDAFRLATSVDLDLRGEQQPFRQFLARPSFIARQTTTLSGFISGNQQMLTQATDWDNTGGVNAGGTWTQPFTQAPSWWLFGATILVTNAAAGVVGDLVEGQITVNTADQVTGVQTATNFWQRNDESNTAGEWLNVFGMAPIYQGQVFATLNLNGSTSKSILLGSRLWGMYLGPVT